MTRTQLRRVFLAWTLILFALVLTTFSRSKSSERMPDGAVPDRAVMQKIWDGWATLDPANTAKFYAQGQHTFFDIAPLKYNSWDEYQQGVRKVLADYQTATFTVNDDAQIHRAGATVWATATVKSEMTEKSGKRDLSTFRWTVIWQQEGRQWLIVHEHVSAPLG